MTSSTAGHTAGLGWSGSPAPEAPDDWWIDDETGEYVNATTSRRVSPQDGRAAIAAAKGGA